MRVTDEWLYEKMLIVDAAMVKRLEDDIDKEYVFSDKFIRHMNRLIKREKYMYSTKILKKIAQRVAVIVVVMLMGTFTVTMSVEACRIHFFHTIKTIFDGKISIYSYELENGNISDAILNLRYLPDGYQLVEEHRTDTSSVMKYSRADENLIFNQKIISNEKMIFDMSFDCMEQIAINGMTVSVYWYRDDTFWAYGEYGNSIYVLAGGYNEMKGFKGFLKAMMAAAMSVTMTLTAFGGGGIGSPCTVYAATDTVVDTGQCGDALTYTVTGDEESGYAMAITGTGDMNNYGLDEWAAPWRDYNFKSISIGDGVTSIGDYAFVLNGNKVKLTIGKKVKSIGECAFSQTGITGTLTIPASVQTIGEYAFQETAITKLVLGKGIKELGDDAFCDTPSLKSVDASKSSKLTLIGDVCFNSDDQLKTMKINANKLKEVGNQSLSTYATTKVTVIAKTKSTYNKAVKLLKDGDRVGFSTLKFAYKKG